MKPGQSRKRKRAARELGDYLDWYSGGGDSPAPSSSRYKRKSQKTTARKKNPTKAERAVKAQKASAKRRVAVALAKFLKQANPGTKLAGAKVEKLKGGVLKITPIKVNPRSTFGTEAEAETFARHIGRHQKARVVKTGNRWSVIWTKRGYQK